MDINDIPISIILVNRNNIIIKSNLEANTTFGHDNLVGEHINILIPEKIKKIHDEIMVHYWNHPVAKRIGEGRDLVAIKKDGTQLTVEIGLYPYQNDVVVVLVDISARHSKNINKELEKLKNKLREIEQKI